MYSYLHKNIWKYNANNIIILHSAPAIATPPRLSQIPRYLDAYPFLIIYYCPATLSSVILNRLSRRNAIIFLFSQCKKPVSRKCQIDGNLYITLR